MAYNLKSVSILVFVLLSANVFAQNSLSIQNLTSQGEKVQNAYSNNSQLNPEIIAVNELHMLPDSGRSGFPITIEYTINNTDQFVAFQFDVILPSVLNFITDSVWLFRKTNHIIMANQINQQTLRILAFSPTNQAFTGNDGVIVKIKFGLNGPAGSYNVGLNNVTISNAIGVDILTGYFPSYVNIVSPDISGQSNIDFGEVSVLDTLSYNYQVSNTGNDTLFITEFYSSELYFWNETPLPQNIPPFQNKSFNLKFHNIIKGEYSAVFTIRSNDVDEDPFLINVTANAFAPNYILIQNAEVFVGDTVTLKIDVNNYEEFIDFQVDLDFPTSLTYVNNSSALTNRKQDHILFENILTPNKIRLFSFSLNELPFTGNSGTVVTMNFVAGIDTGLFPLLLSGGILFDSSSQNIIRSTIDGEIHIKPIPTFQLTVSVINKWNMVSAPGINTNGMSVNNWWAFRDPGANVFKYTGTYTAVLVTDPGEGYWMKHLGSRTYNTGDEWPAGGIQVVDHDPISAMSGWNLVGGYDISIPVGSVTTTPPGLINATIFGYNGSYIPATNIIPGYSYWIKLSAPGLINLDGTMSKDGYQSVDQFKDEWGRITITDALQRTYTLYAVNGERVNLDFYEMPPMPPAGSFDVRYSSNRIAEDINSSIKTIDMTSVEYPVTVTIENMSIKLQDETGRLINENIKSGEKITISNSAISKLRVSGELIPDEYALEQNYPNPFNPTTTIEFSLPEDVSSVKLSIYNALGEKVAELVNSSLTAGKYQYQWNAKNIATGMYIYELRADDFVSVKKMLLLK